jgi:hypothetical protein
MGTQTILCETILERGKHIESQWVLQDCYRGRTDFHINELRVLANKVEIGYACAAIRQCTVDSSVMPPTYKFTSFSCSNDAAGCRLLVYLPPWI